MYRQVSYDYKEKEEQKFQPHDFRANSIFNTEQTDPRLEDLRWNRSIARDENEYLPID